MSEFAAKVRRPLTVAALVMAGLAVEGCGGGNKDFDFAVRCQDKASTIGISSINQPGESHKGDLRVTCEDSQGNLRSPALLQLKQVSGDNDTLANRLRVTVNQQDFQPFVGDHHANVNYDLRPPSSIGSRVVFSEIDRIVSTRVEH
jgi:hypothetical protein